LQHLNYLVNLLGIRDLLDREVLGLSGVEQQRVAIVRTLATQPDILLMDEPMKNLDFKTRRRLVSELKQLFNLFNKPTIYVTHDPEEAINLGDVFLILDKGRIVSRASPDQLKNRLVHDYGVKPTSFGSSTT
jgi:ABC-type sugar transport system ATPase subunit